MGNAIAIPALATVTLSQDFVIGKTAAVEYLGQPGDAIVVVLSNRIGMIRPPNTEGFPLFAVPGGWFLALGIGTLDGAGAKTLSLPVPNVPAVLGAIIFMQGVTLSPTLTHQPQITNLVYGVVRES